jgi:pimeloyl-ACP methyl ester carboxylesterase
MFARVPRDAPGAQERLRNTAHGLAESLRLAGTGTQEPVWGLLDSVTTPVHLIVGALDGRFVASNMALRDELRQASFHLIAGAGHAAHLEQPALCAAVIRSCLSA